MTPNPIEEIKQIRHQLGADVGFDIHRIFADLRASQASSGRSYVHHSPRRVSDIQSMHGSDGTNVSASGESTPAAS